jgi:hypothetical protein
MQSLAVMTSERGSVVYSSRVTDMTTGAKTLADFKNRDPYRYVPFLDGGVQAGYRNLLNGYVAARIGAQNVISGQVLNSGDYASIQDYIIVRRVTVNIRSQYDMPTKAVTDMFGVKDPFSVDSTAVSTVADPVEFVRNTDLCVDILLRNEAVINLLTKIHDFLNSLKSILA